MRLIEILAIIVAFTLPRMTSFPVPADCTIINIVRRFRLTYF